MPDPVATPPAPLPPAGPCTRLQWPWALPLSAAASLESLVGRAIAGPNVAAAKPKPKASSRRGRAALIPVHGVLVQRTDDWSDFFGEVGTEDLARAVSAAAADDATEAVVLHFASPGGSAYGVPELAAVIAEAAAVKKCVAVVDPLCASGAYWLASQCSEVVVSPSGEVGSIGVFQLHVDKSKAMEEAGYKVTPVSVGKYKTATNPYEPLSAEGRGLMEKGIRAIYDRFVRDVARGRGVSQAKVRGGFGEGGMVPADDAVGEGMADRVATLGGVLARYGGVTVVDSASVESAPAEKSAAAAVEIRKRRLLLG